MTIKKTIYNMLKENTGVNMLDSGGEDGRAWQRNQGKTLKDFEAEGEVIYNPKDVQSVLEGDFSVSVFHYLTSGWLMLDKYCDEFNAMPVEDWDSDIYGVSKAGEAWLDKNNFVTGESFNTYNEECFLNQTLQGTWASRGDAKYLLLQVHGGADVRGGYTDAKLFRVDDEPMPNYNGVYGLVEYEDGKQVNVSTGYDGFSLLDDEGNEVKPDNAKKIKLYAYGL